VHLGNNENIPTKAFSHLFDMAEITDNEPSTVVNIAAAGDLVLVIGPEKLKLLVHSLILKTASKPLAAMLGPNWKEGRDMLGADKPVELLLPEDSATALKYICAIIHYQNNTVPRILGAHDILDIAITADKYNVVVPSDVRHSDRGDFLHEEGCKPFRGCGHRSTDVAHVSV